VANWLIDFDMTLSQTFTTQIDWLNDAFGSEYTANSFKDWHSERVLSKEEAAFMWGEDCFLNPDFQMSVPMVEDADIAIRTLLDNGHGVVIVSDRPPSLYDVTYSWIDKNIGEILPVILTRSLHSKSSTNDSIPTKQDIADKLKLTYVVDDAPHHAQEFAFMPNIERVYLVDTPSNRFVPQSDVLVRAESWLHILEEEGMLLTV
jgi:hypothetical protein